MNLPAVSWSELASWPKGSAEISENKGEQPSAIQ